MLTAVLHHPRRYRTMFGPTLIGGEPPPKLNPVIAKFSKPTVAEAILAAMDSDLKAHDAQKDKDNHGYERRRIEGAYLGALGDLDDKRIGPELAARAGMTTTLRQRRQWAYFAHFLDQPKPFAALADEFRQGKIAIPADENAEEGLRAMIGSLIDVGTPAAEAALQALADRKHPQHAAVAKKVLDTRGGGFDRGPWHAHPFCLGILRAAANDTALTGGAYSIDGDRLSFREQGGSWSGGVPDILADPAKRKNKAPERACDRVVEHLSAMVIGLPAYHPLLNDADNRLEAVKKAFDRFAGNYRRANWRERDILSGDRWTPVFVPDLRPLGRAATADDVQAGKAIFHLSGKGKPADLKLPAVAVRKADAGKEHPPRVVIVQAEIGPAGVVYGIIARTEVRMIGAADLTSIRSFADLEKAEKEAEAKQSNKKRASVAACGVAVRRVRPRCA